VLKVPLNTKQTNKQTKEKYKTTILLKTVNTVASWCTYQIMLDMQHSPYRYPVENNGPLSTAIIVLFNIRYD